MVLSALALLLFSATTTTTTTTVSILPHVDSTTTIDKRPSFRHKLRVLMTKEEEASSSAMHISTTTRSRMDGESSVGEESNNNNDVGRNLQAAAAATSTASPSAAVYNSSTQAPTTKQQHNETEIDDASSPSSSSSSSATNNNEKPVALVVSAMAMAWVSVLASIGAGVFIFKYRKNHIVMIGQPPFLGLICFGAFMIAFSIFFDSKFIERINQAKQKQLDTACVVQQWLFTVGILIVYMVSC